jgi:hypothetical protein
LSPLIYLKIWTERVNYARNVQSVIFNWNQSLSSVVYYTDSQEKKGRIVKLANKSSGSSNTPFILFLILILLILGTSKEKIIAILEKFWPSKK